MKKILCVVVVAAMLFASSCTIIDNPSSGSILSGSGATAEKERQDIMSDALKLLGVESLENLDSKAFGKGVFEDFSTLHSNPLSILDYSLELSDGIKNISCTSSSARFLEKLCTEHTFNFDEDFSKVDYPVTDDINTALDNLFAAAGEQEGLSEAKEATSLVETRVNRSLAKWLSSITAAYKIIRSETANVTVSEFKACQNLAVSQEMNEEQISELIRLSEKVDISKIISASLIVLNASGDLKQELKIVNNLTEMGEYLEIETPLGTIYFGTNGDDIYRSPAELLILDLYGNDKYYGRVGANYSLSQPIAVAIDCGGNDIYDYNSYSATQGCGIFGVGVIVNDMGKDEYIAKSLSQGAALCGVGVLIDSSGADSYVSEAFSQSAAFFGIAELADFDGNDSYTSRVASQGFAGSSAIAFLLDKQGNDSYYVDALQNPSQTDKFVNNFSQACAVGLGTSGDESALAGGLAVIVDVSGNDKYVGSSRVQGYSSLGGIALLNDLGGNDRYAANTLAQAVAADYSAASLVDIDGNDNYLLWSNNEAVGQSAVLGGGATLFIENGGNDEYFVPSASFAYNQNSSDYSYAIFVESGGNDIYLGSEKGFGNSKNSVFIDADGEDKYPSDDLENGVSLDKSTRQGGAFLDFMPEETEEDKPTDEESKPHLAFVDKALENIEP